MGRTHKLFYDDGSIYAVRKEELRGEERQIEISRRKKEILKKSYRYSKTEFNPFIREE